MPTEFLSKSAAAAAVGLVNAVGSIAGLAGPFLFGYANAKFGSSAYGLAMLVVTAMAGGLLVLVLQSRSEQPLLSRHSRHDRQNQCGRVFRVMQHGVAGFLHPLCPRLFLSGIQISIETGKIAAGYFQPQLVSGQEHVAGGPQVHRNLVDLSGFANSGSPLNPGSASAESLRSDFARIRLATHPPVSR